MKIRSIFCFLLMIGFVLPMMAGSEAKVEIPDYSMTPRNEIPVEFTWKIEDIYPNMEAWEKDKNEFVALFGRIDEVAEGWTSSAKKMLAMLEFQNDAMKKGIRLFNYVSHQGNMDMGNQKFQQLKGQLQAIFVKVMSKMASMDSDVLKLGKEKFEAYLKEEPGLKPYAFRIRDTLRGKKHVLPTDQQKIITLTGLFTDVSSKASKMLNDVEIPPVEVTLADGKKVALNVANYVKYRSSKTRSDRELVMNSYWRNHKKFENTFALLMDAGIKEHLFNTRVRKYKDCLDARLFGENIDAAVYHNLIKHVRENLEPFHRYIAIKKQLLGIDKFKYEDIYASSVKNVDKKFTFDEAKAIVLKSMKPLGNEYTSMLQHAYDNRWIDVYPNKGKQSGAYSGSVYGVHPFVKMNYNGTYDTVSTLAHELGHSMHSYFSDKNQHFANAGYSTFLAEIASTFNENMLVQYMLKNEKDDLLKLFILDEFIQGIKGTIYRQTQFAEFELAMHQRVESGQPLTAEWLNKKYLELARYYYGHDKGVCEVGDYIQNEWSGIPHFYYNFYVFTYSTGMISSMALSDMVLNGEKAEKEKYLAFLSAGGCRYPLDTLKLAGVDMTTAAPFDAAFKRLSQLVTEMEKIVERLKKKNKI